jgi:hypothetical protein
MFAQTYFAVKDIIPADTRLFSVLEEYWKSIENLPIKIRRIVMHCMRNTY